MKLVMLLALSNASRASDQASPDINFQQFTPKVYISRTHKKKDQVLLKKPFLQVFITNFSVLILYEGKTKDLRTANSNAPSLLLISYRKPHKPITPASIDR